MVSHELRAPLTSIKGSTATVLGAVPVPPEPELLQFFRIIDGQADHMRGLIANLLDAGSIEAGTLTVASEPRNVAVLVDQARNTFRSGGGRHTVLIDIPPDLPPAMADRGRIVQVLNNLLSNAAQHAPKSSPIRVEAASADGYIAISVSDDGRGIPAERLSHLFRKRANLAEGDGQGLTGGTGLGLAICKRPRLPASFGEVERVVPGNVNADSGERERSSERSDDWSAGHLRPAAPTPARSGGSPRVIAFRQSQGTPVARPKATSLTTRCCEPWCSHRARNRCVSQGNRGKLAHTRTS